MRQRELSEMSYNELLKLIEKYEDEADLLMSKIYRVKNELKRRKDHVRNNFRVIG